jgi:hypothetical protein
MNCTYQLETVDNWYADAKPLYEKHWQELGLDLDLKIDPDVDKMRLMEQNGMFTVITVRNAGRLVGYLLAVVSNHLHYRSSPKMFIVDAYYVLPEFRQGTGTKLFKFAEHIAQTLGTIKIYLSCKVHKDHSRLFKTLGYRLSDYAFIKRI